METNTIFSFISTPKLINDGILARLVHRTIKAVISYQIAQKDEEIVTNTFQNENYRGSYWTFLLKLISTANRQKKSKQSTFGEFHLLEKYNLKISFSIQIF